MTTTKLLDSYAGEANADLSSNLHYFAKPVDGDKVDLAGDGGVILGTIIEAAASGYTVTVQTGGIGKVICAEDITAGDRLASDTNGKAVSTSASAGDFEIGTALNSYSSGELVSFLFSSGRKHS